MLLCQHEREISKGEGNLQTKRIQLKGCATSGVYFNRRNHTVSPCQMLSETRKRELRAKKEKTGDYAGREVEAIDGGLKELSILMGR